ncbi:unnamed protein product [Ophioblennius macclurei]
MQKHVRATRSSGPRMPNAITAAELPGEHGHHVETPFQQHEIFAIPPSWMEKSGLWVTSSSPHETPTRRREGTHGGEEQAAQHQLHLSALIHRRTPTLDSSPLSVSQPLFRNLDFLSSELRPLLPTCEKIAASVAAAG